MAGMVVPDTRYPLPETKEAAMSAERIHRARSDDGTEIAGRVQGEGPPLVLVHGAFADGDLEWEGLLPRLSEQFTCYTMSTRGRGLSADHADHSPERVVEDVRAFVDSIGEPVALAGVSGGGMHALGAAARSNSVSALAVYEPVVFEAMEEGDHASFRNAVVETCAAVAGGRPAEPALTFLGFIANAEEREALSGAPDMLEEVGRYGPIDLLEFQHHVAGYPSPSPTAPETLARIAAPVLILHGSRSARTWFGRGARHVAEHVAGSHKREIEGAGHLAVALGVEAVADAFVDFLAEAPQPA
jgi:pimeloyl-ACP methyl ester carboxylesterase